MSDYCFLLIRDYLQIRQPAHLASSPRKRFSTSLCKRSFNASKRTWSITSEVKATLNNIRASHAGYRGFAYRTKRSHLTDRSSYRASILRHPLNLQLRLAVHTGLTGSAQITVRLVSGGLLGILFHQDTSAEDTYGMIIQYVLEQLVAGTIRTAWVIWL